MGFSYFIEIGKTVMTSVAPPDKKTLLVQSVFFGLETIGSLTPQEKELANIPVSIQQDAPLPSAILPAPPQIITDTTNPTLLA